MIRGRTNTAGEVEFYDEASGTVVLTLDSSLAALGTALATTTDPEDGVTIWNDSGTLKTASPAA